MISIRRAVVIFISLVIFVGTLFYVEHRSVLAVKNLISLTGLIDSEYTIVGITDIRSFDHERGDEDSDIVLIEYSDFSCVLCSAMQNNFEKIVREQKVRLVSRHFYLYQNGEAFRRAVAAECVAKYVGESAYFKFSRYLYDNQYEIEGEQDLVNEAISLGVDAKKFSECVDNNEEIKDRIRKDSDEAFQLGAQGTPYIVVVHKGKPIGISYANEYSNFLNRIRTLISDSLNDKV